MSQSDQRFSYVSRMDETWQRLRHVLVGEEAVHKHL